MNDAPIELFTIREAARLLSVPEGWLRKRVSARGVPHTRLGKHVRFTADQLDQLVALGESPVATTHSSSSGLSPRARRAPRSGTAAAIPSYGASSPTPGAPAWSAWPPSSAGLMHGRVGAHLADERASVGRGKRQPG